MPNDNLGGAHSPACMLTQLPSWVSNFVAKRLVSRSVTANLSVSMPVFHTDLWHTRHQQRQFIGTEHLQALQWDDLGERGRRGRLEECCIVMGKEDERTLKACMHPKSMHDMVLWLLQCYKGQA